MRALFAVAAGLGALILTHAAAALEGGRSAAGNAAEPATVAVEAATPVAAGTRFSHCTGVLAAPDLVLTAAHCVDGVAAAETAVFRFRAGHAVPPPLRVAAIVRDPAAAAHWGTRVHGIAARQEAIAADLALLRLAAPFGVRPLRVAGGHDGALRLLAAGASGPRREASGVLAEAALGRLRRTTTGHPLVFATPDGARVCPGDSGAPVVASGPGGPTLWGIVGAVIPERDGCARRVIIVPLAGNSALPALIAAARQSR
ncbi:MAG TPA: trypsin-like serine protease [Hyphomicrobiales bacterium]|nr:trypsin-like serine protease [Hyphomicrobiales bacterium]